MGLRKLLLATIAVASANTAAEAQRKDYASNGVEITYEGEDGFSPMKSAVGPLIKNDEGGYIFAARTPTGGGPPVYVLQGFVHYRGDWRFYDRAYFKGGTAAEFSSLDRKVTNCSRYGCGHSESYNILITPQQLAEFAADGDLQIKIDGKATTGFIATIPRDTIFAVKEAATGSKPPQKPLIVEVK